MKLKETQETTQCRLRNEEAQKCELEDRLEKCHAEIHSLRKDHMGLSEYLQRLARALQWSECSSPPALGNDTNIMAESLLERAERLATALEEHHHHHENMGHHQHRSTNKVNKKYHFEINFLLLSEYFNLFRAVVTIIIILIIN